MLRNTEELLKKLPEEIVKRVKQARDDLKDLSDIPSPSALNGNEISRNMFEVMKNTKDQPSEFTEA